MGRAIVRSPQAFPDNPYVAVFIGSPSMNLGRGTVEKVDLAFKTEHMHVFDIETGQTLRRLTRTRHGRNMKERGDE